MYVRRLLGDAVCAVSVSGMNMLTLGERRSLWFYRYGSVTGIGAFGRSITVFDIRNGDVPFDLEKPDCRGFWVGWHWVRRRGYLPRYYVAFNRGGRD